MATVPSDVSSVVAPAVLLRVMPLVKASVPPAVVVSVAEPLLKVIPAAEIAAARLTEKGVVVKALFEKNAASPLAHFALAVPEVCPVSQF
jgi:hypothetical protein